MKTGATFYGLVDGDGFPRRLPVWYLVRDERDAVVDGVVVREILVRPKNYPDDRARWVHPDDVRVEPAPARITNYERGLKPLPKPKQVELGEYDPERDPAARRARNDE